MTLPLELGPIHDPAVRRALETLSLQFPVAVTGTGGGPPTGAASGDLGGSYPGPTVVKAQAGFTVGGVAIVLTSDSRLTDSRAPTGAASGDLTGSYPGPTVAALAVTDAKVAAANKDGTAATPSMRTLGTGALQATAGNDSRLSDARTPTAHQSSHLAGNADALSGNLNAVARSNVSKAGTAVGTRRGLNLIEGSNVTLTVADDSVNERVNVTVAASAGSTAPALVSSLPGSPTDGQEIYYLADATNGVIWHLRFRTAATTFKWEFLGGRPLFATVATREGTGTTSYAALATAGPSITAPLAGDYLVSLSATFEVDTANSAAYMSFDVGATAAVDADALMVISGQRTDTTPGPDRNRYTDIEKTGLAAATVLVSKYKRVTASSAFWTSRKMWLLPRRVG